MKTDIKHVIVLSELGGFAPAKETVLNEQSKLAATEINNMQKSPVEGKIVGVFLLAISAYSHIYHCQFYLFPPRTLHETNSSNT